MTSIHMSWPLHQRYKTLDLIKKLSFTTKKLIDEPYSCDIGPSKITRILNHNSGGINKRELTSNNCRNHLSKARKNNIGWHCLKVLEYFQRKIEIDEGFFLRWRRTKITKLEVYFGLIIGQGWHICSLEML